MWPAKLVCDCVCVCVFVGVCCVRVVCYVCCVCVLCVCAHAMFMRAYMHVFIIILFVWLKYPDSCVQCTVRDDL